MADATVTDDPTTKPAAAAATHPESLTDVVKDELADISIDLKDVRVEIDPKDHIPTLHLPRLVDHHANTGPTNEEVEAELASAWARTWTRIKAALDVSHYPPMVALVLVVLYGIVFAVTALLLGYPRAVSVTNTCIAFVGKCMGKLYEFRPIQQKIMRKVESLEDEASTVLRKGLDEYVAPMVKAQHYIMDELDELEAKLKEPKVVLALKVAAVTGIADPEKPRAILDEIEEYVAEAGHVLDELVAMAASLQRLIEIARQFNELVAKLVAAYIVLAGCVAVASAVGQPKHGAGVTVAINAGICFFVFAVTLIEHVIVARVFAAVVGYVNERIEGFENTVNHCVRAKLEGALGADCTPRDGDGDGEGGDGEGGGGDGGGGGGGGVTMKSIVGGVEKALGAADVAGGAEGGSASDQSIAAKIKRSVELQKIFEQIVEVVKKAADGGVEDAVERVEDEVEKVVGGAKKATGAMKKLGKGLGKMFGSLGF